MKKILPLNLSVGGPGVLDAGCESSGVLGGDCGDSTRASLLRSTLQGRYNLIS